VIIVVALLRAKQVTGVVLNRIVVKLNVARYARV
jgi:hypothetical protein